MSVSDQIDDTVGTTATATDPFCRVSPLTSRHFWKLPFGWILLAVLVTGGGFVTGGSGVGVSPQRYGP